MEKILKIIELATFVAGFALIIIFKHRRYSQNIHSGSMRMRTLINSGVSMLAVSAVARIMLIII